MLTSSQGWVGHWSPGIGDPTFLGWLTVVFYFMAAGLCWRARGIARRETLARAAHRSGPLWSMLAIGLTALGFNKQLDLQSALTEFGRILAFDQGWYSSRRTVQFVFVTVVLVIAGIASAFLLRAARRDLRRLWLALLGATGLCAFVVIRASSFHRMDWLIDIEVFGVVEMNHLMEIGGILCVAVGAWRFRQPAPAALVGPSE